MNKHLLFENVFRYLTLAGKLGTCFVKLKGPSNCENHDAFVRGTILRVGFTYYAEKKNFYNLHLYVT